MIARSKEIPAIRRQWFEASPSGTANDRMRGLVHGALCTLAPEEVGTPDKVGTVPIWEQYQIRRPERLGVEKEREEEKKRVAFGAVFPLFLPASVSCSLL